MIGSKSCSRRRISGVAFAALVVGLMLVGPGDARAEIGALTVEPESPACTEEVTLGVVGGFPDGCWEVLDVEFLQAAAGFVFRVIAVDHWVPGGGCGAVIVEYDETVTVGPLPPGTHVVHAQEVVDSLRTQGDSETRTFEVTCRAGLTLSPPSGEYLSTQRFDLGILVRSFDPAIVAAAAVATLDGVDVTGRLEACVIPGTLLDGGVTFRCPGIRVGDLGEGEHELTVSLALSDGTAITDTVVWTVVENTE